MNMKISDWDDKDVWKGIEREVIDEREGLARFLVFLAEVERRELHVRNGYSTTKDFCMRGLGLCEGTAKKRIWAAHAATQFPVILKYLTEGKLHFTAVCLLIKHLTRENHRALLDKAAALKYETEIKWWLAGLFPQKLPDERETLIPLDGDKAELRLVVDRELMNLLQRCREVHKHRFPDESALKIVKRALREDLKRHDPIERRQRRKERGKKNAPPQATQTANRRAVPRGTSDEAGVASDDHCNFHGENGVQCTERAGLESDHVFNWGWGGHSTDPRLIQRLCFAHNRFKGRRDFKKDYRKNKPKPP